MKPLLRYQFQITQVSRYDWSALVSDMHGEKPESTTILGKSLPELMAKLTVAVVLRDKNAAIPEEEKPQNGDMPIILTQPKRIIQPPSISP